MSISASNSDDVYLLVLHPAYTAPEHPVPINGTIVHTRTLLHQRLPQPSGIQLYKRLVEVPRSLGELVPLSTVAAEIGGRLSEVIPDWEELAQAVARIARDGACDAMPLGLPEVTTALLAIGPQTRLTVHHPRRTGGVGTRSTGEGGPKTAISRPRVRGAGAVLARERTRHAASLKAAATAVASPTQEVNHS